MNNTVPNVDEVVSELIDMIDQYCEEPQASINIINNIITSIKDNPDLFIKELEDNCYFFASKYKRCPYCNEQLQRTTYSDPIEYLGHPSFEEHKMLICPKCKEEF